MSTGFTRAHKGGARLRIASEEADVVRTLVGQLVDLLGEPGPPKRDDGMPDVAFSENTEASDDPVLARLFPDAYGEDAGASAEFRRYTEVSLRDGKRETARIVLETLGDGGDIRLDPEQAQAWLRALNDIRLALGTRLELTEESLEEMRGFDWNDPRYAAFAAYDWLTYLQESLIRAIS